MRSLTPSKGQLINDSVSDIENREVPIPVVFQQTSATSVAHTPIQNKLISISHKSPGTALETPRLSKKITLKKSVSIPINGMQHDSLKNDKFVQDVEMTSQSICKAKRSTK
jgi:hypothetical protein